MTKSRRKEIALEKVVEVTKIATLFLIAGICCRMFLIEIGKGIGYIEFVGDFAMSLIFVIGVLYIYWIWNSQYKEGYVHKSAKSSSGYESIIIMAACTLLIIVTGGYQSSFKIIFLVNILLAIVEHGVNKGIQTTVLAGGLLLLMNLAGVSRESFTYDMVQDIILIAIFFMVAYLLSFFVKLENEYGIEVEEPEEDIDRLTGAYNHGWIQKKVDEMYQSTDTADKYIVLVDIDYFETYNEVNGYAKGDKVLSILPSLIEKSTGEEMIARFGGDQFAILITGKSRQEIKRLAFNLCSVMKSTYIVGQESQPAKCLTLSVGVSENLSNVKHKSDFIKTAEVALKRTKLLGRDGVECYIDILAEIQYTLDEEENKQLVFILDKLYRNDEYTYKHSERVAGYARRIATELGLNDEEKDIMVKSAYLHDIGKADIEEAIIKCEGPLSEGEWDILMKHSKFGADMIEGISGLEKCVPVVLHHHERFNGTGYPSKLRGEEIPCFSRVLAVIDSFDAMVNSRPYGESMSYEEALLELERWSGAQFDPCVVKVFKEMIEKTGKKY